MTRKQRQQSGRNITYDLSNPRNVAAFEALLEDEEADQPVNGSPVRSQKASRQGKQKREKEKFFMLRADAAAASDSTHQASEQLPQNQEQLQQLLDMFQGTCDAALVKDVLHATEGSFEAAVDALLSMVQGAPPSSHSDQGASSSAAAEAAAAAAQWQQQQQSTVSWSVLPTDVRLAILAQLTSQDIAQAAGTCSEFRQYAAATRAHVRHLVLNPGLSYSCLRGMVGSHIAAAVMDFSTFERHISRQNPEELLPQVIAMHKQEAEANLFRGLLAVAEGSGSSLRTTPVTGLILRRLVGTTDRLLAEALQKLKGLRSLDISHCPALTNKTLYQLAKYKAAAGAASQDQPQEEVKAEEADFWNGWASSSTSSGSSQGSDSGGELDEDEIAALEAAAESENEAAQEADAAPTAAQVAADSGNAQQQDGQQQQQDDAEEHQQVDRPAAEAVAAADSAESAAVAAVSSGLTALQVRSYLFNEAPAADAFAAPVLTAPTEPSVAAAVGLQELKLSGNRAFLDDGLRQVLQGPVTKHSLTKLDISGCRSFTSSGLIVPPFGVLRELRACRCSGLTQLILHMPSSHPLSVLDLSSCHYLQKVDLVLAGLQQLNLSACRTLYRLRMRCPVLRSLSLSQCGMLHDFHEDAWQVPALQQLNLFGCRRASGAQLQVVLDSLPDLTWISLNGCWGIQRLHLTRNLVLESIDLSGCRNIVAFSSASTSLQQLTAASCSRLYSLTLSSNQLKVLHLQNCSQLTEVHITPVATGNEAGAGAESGIEMCTQQIGCSSGAGSSSGRPSDAEQQQQLRAASGQGRAAALRSKLNTKGCTQLSAAARARLVSALAAPV